MDKPVLIHNFGDYERIFGGLWKDSEMGYAVYHYFLNGGVDALIVRVYRVYKQKPPSSTPTPTPNETPPGGATFKIGYLKFVDPSSVQIPPPHFSPIPWIHTNVPGQPTLEAGRVFEYNS